MSVLSHTVADGWKLLSVLAGRDAEDPYSRSITALPAVTRKVRIGIPSPLEFLGDAIAEAAFTNVLARLKAQAEFDFVDIPLGPFVEVAKLLYEGPWVAERRLAISDFFAVHADAIEPTVRAIIDQADGRTAVDAFAAMYKLETGKRMAEAVFAEIDVLAVAGLHREHDVLAVVPAQLEWRHPPARAHGATR